MGLQKRMLCPRSTGQCWALNYCVPNEYMDTAGVAARVATKRMIPPLIAHPSDIAKYVLQLHSDTGSL